MNIRHDINHSSGKRLTGAILIDTATLAVGVAGAIFLPEIAVAAAGDFVAGLVVGGVSSCAKGKLGILQINIRK